MQHAMFGCVEFKLLIILQNNQIKTQKLLHIMSNLWCCVAKEELKKSTTSLNAKTFLLKSCHVMILGAEGITSFEMKKKITKKKNSLKMSRLFLYLSKCKGNEINHFSSPHLFSFKSIFLTFSKVEKANFWYFKTSSKWFFEILLCKI